MIEVTYDALKKRVAALEKRVAELKGVLRAFPGFVDDATIGDAWIERKNAALGDERNV